MYDTIKDYPIEIYNKIWERIIEEHFPFSEKVDLDKDSIKKFDSRDINGALTWAETEEGEYFWSQLQDGELDVFYEVYPRAEDLKKVEDELFSFFKS